MKKRMLRKNSQNQSKNYVREDLTKSDLDSSKLHLAIKDYERHFKRSKIFSNHVLAILIVLFTGLNIYTNYYIVTNVGVSEITGMATGSGRAVLCTNHQPSINISNCSSIAYFKVEYSCGLSANDSDFAYTNMNLTFYDNTSLFDITKLTNYTGEINFTPLRSIITNFVGNYEWNYTIQLRVNDGSSCSTENDTGILNLTIIRRCSDNNVPDFDNLESNYSFNRDDDWNITINTTDDDDDDILLSYSYLNYNAYMQLSNPVFDSGTGFFQLSSDIRHIGWHLYNISVEDSSGCQLYSNSTLVNITVLPNNTAPVTTGSLASRQWIEDHVLYNAFNLDNYFNDSDGDCLMYEVAMPLNIGLYDLTNNIDPRIYCWKGHRQSV